MGEFLSVSIATKITVLKGNNFIDDILSKKLFNDLNHYFQLDLYHQSEDDEMIYFDLKEEVIKDHLCSFLKDHVMSIEEHRYMFNEYMYHRHVDKCLKEIELLEGKTTHEVIDYLKSNRIECISLCDSGYPKHTYVNNDFQIYFEGISYLDEGKVFMETFYGLFEYLHNIIRSLHKNPLEGTTFIDIS